MKHGNRNFDTQGEGTPSDERATLLAKQRAERRRQRGDGSEVDWSAADGKRIAVLIHRAACDGYLVSFGYKRDNSGYSVGFYQDGDRYTEYCRPTEDLDTFLDMLLLDFN